MNLAFLCHRKRAFCGLNNGINQDEKMEKQCSKFIVSGHVQGVGFRYHTSHQGLKLGLTGYAKISITEM